MSETRGVFALDDILDAILSGNGVDLNDVWTASPSPNTGYFGGGAPGSVSTMDKVTYSTDTRTTVPGAALSSARLALAATGNSTSGYFGGGPGPV